MRDFILLLIFLVIGGSLWYYIKFERVPGKDPEDLGDNPEGFPLELGDRDGNVSRLQLYLNIVHDAGLPVNGFFDKATRKSIERYLNNDRVGISSYQKLQIQAKEQLKNKSTYQRYIKYLANLNLEHYLIDRPKQNKEESAFSSFSGDVSKAPTQDFGELMDALKTWGMERSRYYLNNPYARPEDDISLENYLNV